MKAGWWAHHHDPEDIGLQWPYISLSFPLSSCFFLEKVNIWHHAQDAKQKPQNHSHKSGYRVFVLPLLQLIPILQKVTSKEEVAL